MILCCFVAHASAEDRQRVALITIAAENSARRITGAKENRHGQGRGDPSNISCTMLLVAQKSRNLNGSEQAKRQNNWKNSVNPLRRNQRHQNQSANAPANQPKSLRRHFLEGVANAPTASTKIDNRQSDYQRAPWKKFIKQMRQIEKERLRAMHVSADFTKAGE